MRALSVLVLGLGVLFSSAVRAELRVMTINTEWLWTPHDSKVDGDKFNKGDLSAPAYEQEIQYYAALIARHNVDLVALSEIENHLVAQDLVRALNKGSNTWQSYFKQGRDTATGQDVALISRLEFVEGSLTDFGFPSGNITNTGKAKRLSKVVGAQFYYSSSDSAASPDVRLPNTRPKVGVVTAHFLSKRNDNPKKALNRNKQAVALLKAAREMAQESDALIVLGDFNDVQRSPVLSTLESESWLANAITECGSRQVRRADRLIDHIMFRGLLCSRVVEFDLQSYSDHSALMAEFR